MGLAASTTLCSAPTAPSTFGGQAGVAFSGDSANLPRTLTASGLWDHAHSRLQAQNAAPDGGGVIEKAAIDFTPALRVLS